MCLIMSNSWESVDILCLLESNSHFPIWIKEQLDHKYVKQIKFLNSSIYLNENSGEN